MLRWSVFAGPVTYVTELESSTSSPVATSLEMSMPHQPATFFFPKRQFSISKPKFVVRSIVGFGARPALMELHCYVADTQ